MIRLRSFSFVCIMILTILIGWRLFNYFFDNTKPYLLLDGIEDNAWYAGDINCGIKSSHKGNILITLDDKQLCDTFFIAANDIHNFILPTKNLSNSNHTLKITVTNNSFKKNSSTVARSFFIDNMALKAALLKNNEYHVLQGRTLHLQFQTNKEVERAVVELFSKEYECFPESKKSFVYEAFIPIECEQIPNEYLLTVKIYDKVGNSCTLDTTMQVILYPFTKTTMNVNPKKMKEEEELGTDSKLFEDQMEEIMLNSPKEKLWKGAFCPPMEIAKVTCEFGTVRTTQRKGRYAHKALDVINTPKSVVWAPQDGIVVMKKRFVDTGNTVVIDHGCGVITMLCHLEDFAKINVGDRIAQGNPIGTMGKTGYATGYHLHWEMRVHGVQVDPMQWTKIIF